VTVKTWLIVIVASLAVVVIALAVAVALPGAIVLPDGPTSSPVPTMTTRNWLSPNFSWRAAIIILTALITMVTIALVARAIDRRRKR
jgi:hypothetical protein